MVGQIGGRTSMRRVRLPGRHDVVRAWHALRSDRILAPALDRAVVGRLPGHVRESTAALVRRESVQIARNARGTVETPPERHRARLGEHLQNAPL